jgi:hypothetical protein
MCSKLKLSKKDAQLFLKSCETYKNAYRREKRAYYCEECNAWHTTSRDIEQELSKIEDITDPTYLQEWERLLRHSHLS